MKYPPDPQAFVAANAPVTAWARRRMIWVTLRHALIMGVLAVATASILGCATYVALTSHRVSPATDDHARGDTFWSLSAITLHTTAAVLIATLFGAWVSGAVDISQLLADSQRTRDRKIAIAAWFAVAFYATWTIHAVIRSLARPESRSTRPHQRDAPLD